MKFELNPKAYMDNNTNKQGLTQLDKTYFRDLCTL